MPSPNSDCRGSAEYPGITDPYYSVNKELIMVAKKVTEPGLIHRDAARPVGAGALALSCKGLLAEGVEDGMLISPMSMDHPEFEDCAFSVADPATDTWEKHTEKPFLLWTWFAKRVILLNEETGAPATCVRITLIDPTFATLHFVSNGITESLDMIRSLRGDGPYEPPLPVVFSEISTKPPRKMLRMRILREQRAVSGK